MTEFRFVADVVFSAKDLEDAFEKLEKHFKSLREVGGETEPMFDIGEMHLRPVDDYK